MAGTGAGAGEALEVVLRLRLRLSASNDAGAALALALDDDDDVVGCGALRAAVEEAVGGKRGPASSTGDADDEVDDIKDDDMLPTLTHTSTLLHAHALRQAV